MGLGCGVGSEEGHCWGGTGISGERVGGSWVAAECQRDLESFLIVLPLNFDVNVSGGQLFGFPQAGGQG